MNRRRRTAHEIDDELAFHFASVVEELMREGRSRESAEAEARRRFGDEPRYRRELQRIDRTTVAARRRRELMEAIKGVIRDAVRAIRRSPGLSAGVVIAFALGIGANATMFGIVDRLLLSPPSGIGAPDEVHRFLVERRFIDRRVRASSMALLDYADWTGSSQLAGVAAYSNSWERMIGRGEAARPARMLMVTGNFWSLLGARPAAGRLFTEAEDRAGGEPVVVIGHSLWRSLFGGDPAVIGRTVDFGVGEYTIVGVASRGFTGVDLFPVDLWTPLRVAAPAVMGEQWVTGGRGYNWVRVVARRANGASIEAIEAEATTRHRAGRASDIASERYDPEVRVVAAPLIAARDVDGPKEARVAAWLVGVSAIVLLIACVNVANLLLARALRQRRELAIRLAIGISRRRLVGQTLCEGVLLALAGGLAALAVTRWAGDLVRSVLLPNVEWTDRGMGGATLLLVLGLALLTGSMSAIVPALEAAKRDVADVLRATSGGITRSAHRVRGALSIAQTGLSVVLLVGAGLFVRSLDRVRSLDLGFEMENLWTVRPIVDRGGLAVEDRRQFFENAVDRIERLPGVQTATYSIGVPFYTSWATSLRIPGRDSLPIPPSGGPYVTAVGGSYMQTMDLGIVRGRDFEPADRSTRMVAIVNESLARLYWPGGDALGACLILDEENAPCTTVIGVVEDARRGSVVEEPNPQYYVPDTHPAADRSPEMLYLRASGDEAGLASRVRAELLALEPRLRYVDVDPLADMTATETRSWRLGASMFTVFGVLALIVASIGLYSVLAFDVAQRTRELGLRSALGAGATRLLGDVVLRAMRMTVAGLAIGIVAALLFAPRLSGVLFETSPRDPLTHAGVAVTLLIVAVISSGLPALRASRVDPNIALRSD